MDETEARRRFAAARVGRLATITASGMPHLVPVVFALLGDVLYTAVDSKPKTTMALRRLANIDANGRASLLVDEYSDDWSNLWWVRVDGSAQVLEVDSTVSRRVSQRLDHPDPVHVAVQALTRKYPQYVSQPPPGPVVEVRLTKWTWWEAAPAS